MIRSRVAKRYALALFEAALEANKLEVVESDLHLIEQEYQQVEDLQKLIDSPVISNTVKRTVVTEVFQNRLDPITFDMLVLLIEKNREKYLPGVIMYFRELLDEHRGILRADLYSVVPLTESQLQHLKKRLDALTGKNVIITQHIDPELLGGFTIRINDTVFDSSLKHQLEKLRENLVRAS
ncbi:MAG: F0F1 ATP synthase subunit delta [Calditrichaeota bacterium]|nr:F0F1 ATP synthase subunit delta [Calditrichota bacterium]